MGIGRKFLLGTFCDGSYGRRKDTSDYSAMPSFTHSFDLQYPQNPPQWVDFWGFGVRL
jgi:hypothetical protein